MIWLAYGGALALLQTALSLYIVSGRWHYKVAIGEGDNRDLQKRIRAHGNFIEYAPICLVLIGGIEAAGGDTRVVHGLGVALVIGRLSHAAGLLRSRGPSVPRFVGMTLTYGVLLGSGCAALWMAV